MDDGETIYECTLTEADRVTKHDDLPAAIKVVASSGGLNGFLVYGLYRGRWVANISCRPLARKLLQELGRIQPNA